MVTDEENGFINYSSEMLEFIVDQGFTIPRKVIKGKIGNLHWKIRNASDRNNESLLETLSHLAKLLQLSEIIELAKGNPRMKLSGLLKITDYEF